MISAELQKAIDSLAIQDVYVREQVATCEKDFDPKYAPDIDRLIVQQMHIVRGSKVVEQDDGAHLLRVFVLLGTRWIDPAEENEDLSVRALIEAEFVAEYRMTKELEKACIDEFSLKNTSYHVWPYWRELLGSHCMRMHLPRLMLPTFQLAHHRQRTDPKETSARIPSDGSDA